MLHKFKVGDRVKIKEYGFATRGVVGQTGTVVSIGTVIEEEGISFVNIVCDAGGRLFLPSDALEYLSSGKSKETTLETT